MRAHYLQHVPFEGLGSIEQWLLSSGFSITVTKLFESSQFPSIHDIDVLIVMGGPMSVNDEDDFPWLKSEKQFVKAVVELGKPVLGVCLGAQLIASAFGAAVYANREKEIGWFPVQAVRNEAAPVFQVPEQIQVFHWHGETFDLPEGAVCIAESQVCKHQAFQLGRRAIGLQFHLETTAQSAEAIVRHCRHELEVGAYIQTENEILSVPVERYEEINRLMAGVLGYLCEG